MKILILLSLIFSSNLFAAKTKPNIACENITEQRFKLNEKIMMYEACKKTPKHKLCQDQERLIKNISSDSRTIIALQNKNPKCDS